MITFNLMLDMKNFETEAGGLATIRLLPADMFTKAGRGKGDRRAAASAADLHLITENE